jgi:dTDP-4-amino-4,6-dideoxygalactose transaminase
VSTSERKVPYVDIAGQHAALKAELLEAVAQVLDRGSFILGNEVVVFEERFASLCGVPHAVGLNSGTDALILALRALDIGRGDEVITAPNSFVASASCIAVVGATPVFVDVRDDYNLDPALLERAINPRTRAIIPVHLTGRPADMDPILEVARSHGLHVIEDCAQAVVAEYKGKRVGSFGTFGCFSLHPLKTLNACGDGGMLTTRDPELAERIRLLRNLGLKTREDAVVWSSNSRLDSIQAALLLVKLKYLEHWTERRRANARIYQEKLAGLPRVQTPDERPFEKAVYHTFVVQAERRDSLRKFLADRGIQSNIHYPIPIHLQTVARSLGYGPGSFPVAEAQAQRILSLPVFPALTSEEIQYVASQIHEFYS